MKIKVQIKYMLYLLTEQELKNEIYAVIGEEKELAGNVVKKQRNNK
jgi:hypothetical protein